MYTLLKQRHDEGELRKEWELWDLGAHVDEWLALATEGKALTTHHGSKQQQKELCKLALQKAREVDRQRYFSRGDEGLMRKHNAERKAGEVFRRGAAKRTAEAQAATCNYAPSGKKRKVEASPEAYLTLLNPLLAPGEKAKARHGTGYGNAALTCKSKVAVAKKRFAKPPPGVAAPKPTRSGRRRSERQLRQLSGEPALQRRRTRESIPRKAAPKADELAAAGLQDQLDEAAAEHEARLSKAEAQAAEEASFSARQAARREELAKEAAKEAERREREGKNRRTATSGETSDRQQATQYARGQLEQHELRRRRVKEFEHTFILENGRRPTQKDLEKPANMGARVDRDRYHFLMHGKSIASLQSGAEARRARALEHGRMSSYLRER